MKLWYDCGWLRGIPVIYGKALVMIYALTGQSFKLLLVLLYISIIMLKQSLAVVFVYKPVSMYCIEHESHT